VIIAKTEKYNNVILVLDCKGKMGNKMIVNGVGRSASVPNDSLCM